MDSMLSVSKGVFLLKNGSQRTSNTKRRKNDSLFSMCFEFEPWYKTLKENWENVETKMKDLNFRTYSTITNEIVNYLKTCHIDKVILEKVIPSVTVLTGINQPDHTSQFIALKEKLRNELTHHIAVVHSQDAPSLKHLVENVVWQIINGDDEAVDEDEKLTSSLTKCKANIRKSRCTMSHLKKWYLNTYVKDSPSHSYTENVHNLKPVIVIIPDFECYNSEVLQDFVSLASSYIATVPIVLIFGVATSVSALHKSFPYHISSKLLIKVFHSHSSPIYLNQVLEEVFLTHTCPFLLSGKIFELFMDVFLFYDFSVVGFTQGMKYCIMKHFYGDNTKALCSDQNNAELVISQLSSNDLEKIRQLPSFRPFLEAQNCYDRIALFHDDKFFKDKLIENIKDFHDYLFNFHTTLKVLHVFVKDLPKNLLGKHLRELYAKCSSESLVSSPDFKNCMQFLNFQSKAKLSENVIDSLKVLNIALKTASPLKPLTLTCIGNSQSKNNTCTLDCLKGHTFIKSAKAHLVIFLRILQEAKIEASVINGENSDTNNCDAENVRFTNRLELKKSLLNAAKKEKLQSDFEIVRSQLVDFLQKWFLLSLVPFQTQPFYEIFVYDDLDDVKKQIVGSPRGAIHTALNCPAAYLQCSCCSIKTQDSIVQYMPDVCIVYKLHRECGKMINLYDWIQAFASIIDTTEENNGDERQNISSQIQSRFTQAIAELQFLGFIKSSKRKTDHVMRLTW